MSETAKSALVAVAVASFLLARAEPTRAAVLDVTSTADAVDTAPGDRKCASVIGKCTLRAAVQETNALPGADTIRLPAGTYPLSVAPAGEDRGRGGDLDVTDSLAIVGAGSKVTAIVGNKDRVLDLLTPKEVEKLIEVHITGVTIRGGSAVDAGGGIRFAAVLTVERCQIVSNEAAARGGGLAAQATALRDTRLYLTDSIVSDNRVLAGTGGGVNAIGAVRTIITRSDFLRNQSAVNGGGLAADANSAATIAEARFSRNRAGRNGGGIWGAAKIDRSTLDGNVTANFGAGWYLITGASDIANSTISGNVATNETISPNDEGGGGITVDAPLTMTHVTLTKNSSTGDNASALFSDTAFIVDMANTIILANGVGACYAPIRSGGGNIVETEFCLHDDRVRPIRPDDLVTRGSFIATLNPVLRNNGGRTPTHALPLGSRAINFVGSGLAVDQRGVARPQLGRFDSGAYERTNP